MQACPCMVEWSFMGALNCMNNVKGRLLTFVPGLAVVCSLSSHCKLCEKKPYDRPELDIGLLLQLRCEKVTYAFTCPLYPQC